MKKILKKDILYKKEFFMPILNQPFSETFGSDSFGSLGDLFLKEISKSGYTELCIFSAFAKNSGVLRIKNALLDFKKNGGKIFAFVGIDLQGTSKEALEALFRICDFLVVVHSSRNSQTFHSKIYYLEGAKDYWYAVGSNNLTAGGLWTNFESCYFDEAVPSSGDQVREEIIELKKRYLDPEFVCSKKISSLDDINDLVSCGQVLAEAEISKNQRKGAKRPSKESFGSIEASLPPLPPEEKKQSGNKAKAEIPNTEKNGDIPETEKKKEDDEKKAISAIKKSIAYVDQEFWYESKKLTGGSRNILDLSKTGKIRGGTASGTEYEISGDPTRCIGGVRFFGIDPEDVTQKKDIRINFDGYDYFPATILYPTGANKNGTWRLQLKGSNQDNPELDELSSFGHKGTFVNKILIFDRISDDYFALYVMDDTEENLLSLKSDSVFWAQNGILPSSKSFGLVRKTEDEG
jgi:HKD family nuclease